ncbi:hypothetical protein [Chondrinema litorale]|uniref:hypothetical protein n=1 Tax=Chondrinema litorale TaxID=2994555 RepID=UPI00254364F5|nr:hypothetical protein [Chondrinema litorale]UZS00022.1 hypothetical protein OQ292_39260 [Chondrinema litorale]
MKRLFITLLILSSHSLLKAQKGFNYLDVAGGTMIKNQLVSEISYEWVGKYYSAHEVFLEYAIDKGDEIFKKQNDKDFSLQDTDNSTDTIIYNPNDHIRNFMVGYAYKPLITRNKNVALNLRTAGSTGTNELDFIASLSLGFELNVTFSNGWVWTLREKNQVVFYDPQSWRIGLLTGIKIPLTKD